jgi:3-oxoadipate CoA-transferase alpha subunit
VDKVVGSIAAALAGIRSGSTILVGGFGEVGSPVTLLNGLLDTEVKDLVIVANNAGVGDEGLAALLREHRVRKVICSFPRGQGSKWFEERFAAGQLDVEVVPQGTLSERIRAAGAGIGGFFTPTGAGTVLAANKETRTIGGRLHVYEEALSGDVSLISAHVADHAGNLTYHASARNFAPTMAAASQLTVAQVKRIVPTGALDPENVITPGIYVDRVVIV